MNLEIKIDKNEKEPKLLLITPELTTEIDRIINSLNNSSLTIDRLNLIKDDSTFIVKLAEIETIYSSNNKIYVKTDDELYTCKYKLYELEDLLKYTSFE